MTYQQCVTDADGRCIRWTHNHGCPSGWHGPWLDGACVDCGTPKEV